MAGELVLITGISGFIGFRILAVALESGYRGARSNQAPHLKNLEFVVVPDMLKDGAYDDVLDGVTYILHCASPIPDGDFETAFVTPAVKGTIEILHSALQKPNIKRVVITSSIGAIISFHDMAEQESSETFNGKPTLPLSYPHALTLSPPPPGEKSTVSPAPTGPYTNPFTAYSASKVHALHATNAFVATHIPHFAVINTMPAGVIGPNELTPSPDHVLDSSNAFAFAQVLGHEIDSPIPGNSVSVGDCARIHVRGLDPDIAVTGTENFILAAGGVEGTVWADAVGIVERHFPQAVKDGVLPLGGRQSTKKIHLDARRTEEVFGVEWEGFEQQVVALTRHYLELVDKEKEKEKQGKANTKI